MQPGGMFHGTEGGRQHLYILTAICPPLNGARKDPTSQIPRSRAAAPFTAESMNKAAKVESLRDVSATGGLERNSTTKMVSQLPLPSTPTGPEVMVRARPAQTHT